MSLYTLVRSLRHRRPTAAAYQPLSHFFRRLTQSPEPAPLYLLHSRSFAFSSAEEAAAERRRRKRRLRIEPPLHALRASAPPPVRDPNAPRLPDSTSALVGKRLSLHNRVQSLIRASDLDAASLLARSSVFSSTRPTVFTCNAIIAAMYRNKRFDEAIALFHFFFNQSDIVPNIVSYNNLINTHCDRGEVDKGLEIYRHILANAPFSPSAVTYRHLTKGLIDTGRIQEAVDLLREMLNKGHGADSLVYNNLISGFLELGNLEKANELFDELKERCLVYDGVVNATFMEWWFKQGKDREAMESYKSLLDRKFRMVPATCNVLLEVLMKYGKTEQAWTLFGDMLDNHTPPNTQAVNSDTFNIMVNACFKLKKFEEAIQTFKKVGTKPNSRPFVMDVNGYSSIITRFNEHGMLFEAEKLFEEMCSKSLPVDVPSYRNMIDAYINVERIDDALRLFTNMVNGGLRVVADFGTRVFSVLLENGKYMESAGILRTMGEKETKPDASIYDVVVRGLCGAGELDLGRDVVDQMVSHAVGVPPALQAFVRDVFGNAGRSEEIERVLDENRWETPRPAGPRNRFQPMQSAETSRMGGQHPSGSWGQSMQSRLGPSQMGAQHSPGSWGQTVQSRVGPTQMSGHQQSGSWGQPMQSLLGSSQASGHQQPGSWSHQLMQSSLGSSQMTRHQQSGSWGQKPMQSPLGSSEMSGHQQPDSWGHQPMQSPSGTSQVNGHEQLGSWGHQPMQSPSGTSQVNGHQQTGSWSHQPMQSPSGASQANGHQQPGSWGHQPMQSPSGTCQANGHQQPGSWGHQPMQSPLETSQMSGQQQSSSWGQPMQSSLGYSQTSGHQQLGSWGQPSQPRATPQLPEQQQSGSLEVAGQDSRFSWAT